MISAEDIGPDGRVRLRSFLPHADALWFLANCQGEKGCGRAIPIGVRKAIGFMGSAEATVGELERRLKCGRCGNPQIGVTVQPDARTAGSLERNGPAPETRAEMPD